MPRLQYGQTTIEWRFKADATLKRHYVTVERGRPVLLRGPAVGLEEQEALVRQRARWIREKRALVEAPAADEQIVTGSRLRYCGRTYFTEVRHAPKLAHATLHFTASRFVIENPVGRSISAEALAPLLNAFYGRRRMRSCWRACGTGSGSQACRPGALAFATFGADGPAAMRRTCWSSTPGDGAAGQRAGLCRRARALPHGREEPHTSFLGAGDAPNAGLAQAA